MKLGIVGGGAYGSRLTKIFSDAHRAGKVDFRAIADIRQSVLDEAKHSYGISGYLDYKEMIEKEQLDAIAVVTPDYLHEEISTYGAEKKLHMLVQKPLDITAEGAGRIAAAAEKSGVLLYVDFHKRFDPSLILARNKLEQGALGELLYGYVNVEDTIEIPSVWFKNWADKSSPAWFIGIHFCDILNFIIGSPPVSVSAIGGKKKLLSMGIDTYDFIQARMRYQNGAVITMDTSWILPMAFPSNVNQNLRLIGTEGMIEVDGQHRGVELWSAAEKSGIDNPYGYLVNYNELTQCGYSGYTVDSVLYFISLLEQLEQGVSLASLKGRYPDGEGSTLATRVVEAIHQSADRDGAIVSI